jgi:prophage regulatory protein
MRPARLGADWSGEARTKLPFDEAKRTDRSAYARPQAPRRQRDELIGTLHELYGRGNEMVLRILDDVRTLVRLHQETTELLYTLRSLPSEGPPAQLPTPAAATPTVDSGARLPRLVPFREVAQRVALSRSTIWRLERAGQFPRRRRLSVNKVAWWEPEIEEWLGNRDRP